MTSSEKSPVSSNRGGGKSDAVFVYGHDTKKLRLRAISAEKDTFFKYISKPLAKRVSLVQLFLAACICGTQIVTMTLVTGHYSYDSMAETGGGLWTSFCTGSAALLTLWSLKNAKYWKLHMSFAMHIISMMAAMLILIIEFGGNLRYLKHRVWEATYADAHPNTTGHPYRDGYYYGSGDAKEWSSSALITSLLLNTLMATGTLVQLVSSLLMTLMTGRAICCGQSKTHGKLFELEIAGSETADGIAVLKHQLQNNVQTGGGIGNANVVGIPAATSAAIIAAAPPPYAESVAKTVSGAAENV